MPSIYQPAEDSYLMSSVLSKEIPKLLKKNPQLKVLEVGVGSGINLLTIKKAGVSVDNIMGCDINPDAVEHCKKLGFNCIESNLFSNIKGKFEIIIFNPPYLPDDKEEPVESKTNTTAGNKGNEIVMRFLKQAKKHLADNGVIYLITSSLSREINLDDLGYKPVKIGEEKLFFEKIFVWMLSQKLSVKAN